MLYAKHLMISALFVRRGHSLCVLGDKSVGCSWAFCPEGLGAGSVVYSGGVGNDISFEHALVERFGCSVTLFDPSPTGRATMNRPENQISKFKFLPLGLARECGTLRLARPLHEEEGSWYSNQSNVEGIEVRCLDLATMLAQNQHRRVDLLKIDIEGAEYGVIEHILKTRLPVHQILVEFHDGMLPGIRKRDTFRAVFGLMARGYKLVCERSNNYTFVRDG